METHLDRTLMRKTDVIKTSDSTNSIMSQHENKAKFSDLWRLDTVGIPIQAKEEIVNGRRKTFQ